jgi:hypothetical protein
MKCVIATILCLAAFAGAREAGHPIESVINLLKELQLKVESESEAETATWIKFKGWCTTSVEELAKAIDSSKEDIETLTDTVSSKTKEEAAVKKNIAFLEDEIAKYDQEDIDAKKARDDAEKVYKAADKDFDDTITAVDEAVKALRASKKSSMLQFLKPETPRQEQALKQLLSQPLVLEQLSEEQRDALSASVYGPVTDADILAKEKYAKTGQTYTFKSGNVIELLDGLKAHFEDSKERGTKAETAAANDYEVAKDARKDAVDAAKKAKDSKNTLLGDVQADLATAKGDLKDDKDEFETDSKTKVDTEKTCKTKADQFEERTELRRGEMKAMKAAVEILAEVSGVRTEAADTKALPSKPKFFLQIASLSDPKMKALTLIRKEANEAHSKELQRFADQLSRAMDGPFDQITNMIQKMIFRLMAEQTDEDKHKKWCDQEISVSETSRDDKADKIKSLEAKKKDAKAHSDELVLKIKDLDKKVADLAEFMADATEIRNEGKKENELAIKDAESAQAAIAKAEAVLESYYKDSGMIEKEAWEFLQKPSPVSLPEKPESWSKSYTGVTDPNKPGGVLAVLQATAADFAKMEADSRAQEAMDQKQFDEDMKSAAIDKAGSAKESEMKTDENKRTLDKVTSLTKKVKHTTNEHGAVKQYLEELKPACVDGDSSYKDRKAARDKEITALKEAQGILEYAFKEESMLQTIHKHA